jgi:hypothetical protein
VRHPTLTIAISPQALKMLRSLATKGLYGRGLAGVAREFLYQGLRKHLVDEKIVVPKRKR